VITQGITSHIPEPVLAKGAPGWKKKVRERFLQGGPFFSESHPLFLELIREDDEKAMSEYGTRSRGSCNNQETSDVWAPWTLLEEATILSAGSST
jgi:hypothetical protein